MSAPRELRYTKTHEWVRTDGNIATVGITDFAQEQLGDLTYVELPEPGDTFAAQDEVAVVESVKAASDIYAPVSGTVKDVNTTVTEQPDLLNSDPFGAGWLFSIEMTDPSEADALMDADAYEESLPDE